MLGNLPSWNKPSNVKCINSMTWRSLWYTHIMTPFNTIDRIFNRNNNNFAKIRDLTSVSNPNLCKCSSNPSDGWIVFFTLQSPCHDAIRSSHSVDTPAGSWWSCSYADRGYIYSCSSYERGSESTRGTSRGGPGQDILHGGHTHELPVYSYVNEWTQQGNNRKLMLMLFMRRSHVWQRRLRIPVLWMQVGVDWKFCSSWFELWTLFFWLIWQSFDAVRC